MQSPNCSRQRRLWNRDLAACLNMHHIVRNLRSDGSVPQRFRRGAVVAVRIQEPEPAQRNVRVRGPRRQPGPWGPHGPQPPH
ncbi:hypothetical protein BX666DRAFT_1870125 [Dichotomocladium elegans]|nr:hypothetical protein BX666DRAFT_1870125 [Dichotomocladium elegans]